MMPVMARNLLESIRLLAHVAPLLADRCIAGIDANEERMLTYAESSPSVVTPLNKYIGYEEAAKVAKAALKEGRTIREQVLEMGYVERGDLTEEQLDAALDVRSMTRSQTEPRRLAARSARRSPGRRRPTAPWGGTSWPIPASGRASRRGSPRPAPRRAGTGTAGPRCRAAPASARRSSAIVCGSSSPPPMTSQWLVTLAAMSRRTLHDDADTARTRVLVEPARPGVQAQHVDLCSHTASASLPVDVVGVSWSKVSATRGSGGGSGVGSARSNAAVVAIRVRLSTRSGCCTARSCAIPPPMETPTRWACAMPEPVEHAQRVGGQVIAGVRRLPHR